MRRFSHAQEPQLELDGSSPVQPRYRNGVELSSTTPPLNRIAASFYGKP
jgi:hypothetical protein